MIASGGFWPTAETTSVIPEKWSALSNHPKVKKISHSLLLYYSQCVSTIEYRTSEEKEKARRDTCRLYWKRYWILLLSARNQFALPATDPFPFPRYIIGESFALLKGGNKRIRYLLFFGCILTLECGNHLATDAFYSQISSFPPHRTCSAFSGGAAVASQFFFLSFFLSFSVFAYFVYAISSFAFDVFLGRDQQIL